MRTILRLTGGLLPVWSVLAGACAPEAGGGPGTAVVATTTIMADLARGVAGDRASVEVLMPPGTDPHDFEASAQQVAAMGDADLVLAVGLGLEEGLGDTLRQVDQERGNVLEVAPELDPLPLEHEGGEEEAHGSGEEEAHAGDPHVWQDPVRMAEAATLVADRLERIQAGEWRRRAEAYREEVLHLHRETRDMVARVPEERRKLVTNHDTLSYWADRYGFEVVGVVLPGGSTLTEPNPAAFSEVARTIREEGIPAVFAETVHPTRLAEALAEETGTDVRVVELFTDSVGEPGSGAETYIDMMRTNAERIVSALTEE